MSTKAAVHVTATTRLPTRHGLFRFESFRFAGEMQPHLALSMGLPTHGIPLVRLHSECLSGDVFGSVKCDCGDQLQDAMRLIGQAGSGVLIYLRQEGRGIGIEQKIRAYKLQEAGLDTVDANLAMGLPVDSRTYDAATAYLERIDVRRCVLLTNNPQKVDAVQANGTDVKRRPLHSSDHHACRGYLATKRARMGHDC